MKMPVLISVVCGILSGSSCPAQHIAAFTDKLQHFYIFDSGVLKKVEYLPVRSYKAGYGYAAYVDNSGNFKVYHNGGIQVLAKSPPAEYHCTKHLMVYVHTGILTSWNKNETVPLTYNLKDRYEFSDSLVAFYDHNRYFHVYNGREVLELEPVPVKFFTTGPNLLTYVNAYNEMKIFYENRVIPIDNSSPGMARAGLNILSYTEYDQYKIFYKGKMYEMDLVPPQTVITGADMAAYLDNLGKQALFWDGTIYRENEYLCHPTDSLATCRTREGSLAVFYKGEFYTLENYLPEKFQADGSTLAYMDRYDNLKIWSAGRHLYTSENKVLAFELRDGIVTFSVNQGETRVWYEGKVY